MPAAPPRMQVVHAEAAGRLRLSVTAIKRALDMAERAEMALAGVPDVSSVRANSRTGNVLICFDPSVSHQAMLKRAADALDGNAGAAAKPLSAAPAAAPRRTAPGPDSDWHTRAAADILEDLSVRADSGLNAEQAAARIRRHGRNIIPEAPPTSAVTLLARQIKSLPVWMLLGASAASIATGGVLDAVVTVAVVSVNAGISYVTESVSERTIRRMTAKRPSTVPVLRGGREIEVDSAQIVPGDILMLKPDTIIAADARLVEVRSLMVNESLLTGESEAVQKEADTECPARWRSPSPRSPKAFRPPPRPRSPLACAHCDASRFSCAVCQPWRRWAAFRPSASTRPARSPKTGCACIRYIWAARRGRGNSMSR